MCPRVAKTDRQDPPKPMVQLGTVGGMPFTAQMLSYRAEGYVDVLMGGKDTHETLYHKEHPVLTLQAGKTTESIDLAGSLFNGISDAFYRGKLPEILLVAPSISGLDTFLEEWLEHLDKLSALGFFLSAEAFPQLLPTLVLAGNGIFYTGFCKKLSERLSHMDALPQQACREIQARVVRGVFSRYEALRVPLNQPVIREEPSPLYLAGGSSFAQNTARTVLAARNFQVTLLEKSPLPAERLEVQQALYRLHTHVLPALNQLGALSLEEMREDQLWLSEALLRIGKQRQLFEEKESLSRLQSLFEEAGPPPEPTLVAGDSTGFRYLLRYMDPSSQAKERQRAEELKQNVLHQLEIKRKSET